MVLINKQPKLSCHMASMPINDRRLIKPVMLICFGSAKFLLYGVNIVSFSNDHNGPRSAVGNVSGYRCVSDCRSRGREFDPGPVPYFCGD